jgi:hypothetical protein
VRRSVGRLGPVRRLASQRRRLQAAPKQEERVQRLKQQLAATKGRLRDSEQQLKSLRTAVGQWPPGHYYSPIPDLADVRARQDRIWSVPSSVPGIDMHADEQLGRLTRFAGYAAEQPFGDQPRDGLRYGFDNRFFSYGDGLVLYCMLRDLRPARLIEIGSGWSSALTLDVNERFLGGQLRCTFIEPYAERLRERLTPADLERVEILETDLSEVDRSVFETLAPGDILFIDSTHVSRIGSDVNQLIHEVLPILPPGVHVHVHDIFWPFEYPKPWVLDGRMWNEAYVLRAYLTDNPYVRISWFSDYLRTFHGEQVGAALPLWWKNTGGSLWFVTQPRSGAAGSGITYPAEVRA